MKKLNSRIPLELSLFVTLVVILSYNFLIMRWNSTELFILANSLIVIALFLGRVTSSMVLIWVIFITTILGWYILFVQLTLISNETKFLTLSIMPVFSFLAYIIQLNVILRKEAVLKRRSIQSYLHSLDLDTRLRGSEGFHKFFSKCRRYLELTPQYTDHFFVTLFRWEYYDQYVYINEQQARRSLTELADTLKFVRLPEEHIFYMKNGTFAVITPRLDEAHTLELNKITKTQMKLIPFRATSDKLNELIIKMATLEINPASMYDSDQALKKLQRLIETDLSAEYM